MDAAGTAVADAAGRELGQAAGTELGDAAGGQLGDAANSALGDHQALLRFEHVLRVAHSHQEVLFAAVNEPYGLFPYDQAIVWLKDAVDKPEIAAVSGLSSLEGDTPYSHWLTSVFSRLAEDPDNAPKLVTADTLPTSLVEEGAEWQPPYALHVPLRGPDGRLRGGWWITRNTEFNAHEQALAQWVGEAIGYSLWGWDRERLTWSKAVNWIWKSKVARWIFAVLALSLLIPVQLSALAPAEVTAFASIPITAPTEGVVQDVLVQPNQLVEEGTPLIQFDDTTIRNRILVAQKARETAFADMQRTTALAFAEDSAKSDLQVLDARVRERDAEIAYLNELLQRQQVVAPRKGIAVFSDAQEWRGKPVQTGERIMTLADPENVALTIYLSPEDAVQLDVGAEVRMYLNVAPLSSYAAHITQTSYEVSLTPEVAVAYILRAALDDPKNLPRIGLRGTAKVYASPVPLFYYVMRKPIHYLRRAAGL